MYGRELEQAAALLVEKKHAGGSGARCRLIGERYHGIDSPLSTLKAKGVRRVREKRLRARASL